MLVVTRKAGESIIIGDNIEISIVELQNGKVKIGIEAPRDIKILRKEILDQVKNENKNANIKSQNVSLDSLQNLLKKK